MSGKSIDPQEHIPIAADRPIDDEVLQFDSVSGQYEPQPITQVVSGAIQMYGAAAAPSGYLLCDGTSYATATYAALYAIIGYTWGGSGANFNVPDMRSRSPVGAGQGSGLTNRALAATGGVETHPLVTAELASHSHGVTDSGHDHSISLYEPAVTVSSLGQVADSEDIANPSGFTAVVDSATTGISIDNTGSGTAHETMHPFLSVSFIIKT